MSALLRAFYHILLSFICWREFLRSEKSATVTRYFNVVERTDGYSIRLSSSARHCPASGLANRRADGRVHF